MENDKDFGLRLFDVVKESLSKTESKIETLSNIVSDLVKSSSAFPTNKDIDIRLNSLKSELDVMDRNALEPSKNIKECSEEIKEIKSCMLELKRSMKNVIYTIVIAFSLITISYVFVSNSVSNIIQKQIDVVKEETMIDKEIEKKLKYLFKDINIEGGEDETEKTSE
jgi:predicted  nucleic acid-binding Zn-ribbon protein